jgi:hypothetical protein
VINSALSLSRKTGPVVARAEPAPVAAEPR